jgi:hypothetical protein
MNTQKQLLVVIPYCVKDAAQTRSLLTWIEKLSPKLGPHCCLLAADSLVPHETKLELGNMAKRIFYFAETAIINVPPDITGWPKASNAMFRIASQHVQECFKLPFLWMEPDCVPLKPSWLDELALSYYRCPKRYMGTLIRSQQPPMPPVHLAGCAVYPAEASKSMEQFTNGPAPWDIANAPYVVPRAYDTPLIHHHYGTMELAPTFKELKEPTDPVNTCTFDFVREGAVLFHRVKNSTLIDLLAKQMDSAPVPAPEIKTAPTEAPVKRGPGRPRKEQVLVPA